MPDASPDRRPSVLLLAGEVRDDWTRALEAGGIDVATTGWLDGITSARLKRPDLLLVSTDLPEGALQSVISAFRNSSDLRAMPLAVVGPEAERLGEAAPGPIRADHYLPLPDGNLAAAIKEALRVGRVPWRRRPIEWVVLGLAVVPGMALIVTRALREFAGTAVPPAVDWTLFAATVFFIPAAFFVVGVAAKKRPLSIAEWRVALGWLALLLVNGGRLVPGGGIAEQSVGFSLGACALAAWARLGPLAKPRTPRVRRAFHLLAAALLLLGAAPWAALAWWGE